MKYFGKSIAHILLIAMLLGLCGCGSSQTKETTPAPVFPEMHKEISYDLYGTWITADGELQESVDFHISGQVDMDASGEDTMTLDISFPDTFTYSYLAKKEFASQSRKYFGLSYCVSTGFSWRRGSDIPVISYLALCPEKEYVLFYWDERPGRYLVASTDPDTAPEQIISYFEVVFEKYITGD